MKTPSYSRFGTMATLQSIYLKGDALVLPRPIGSTHE